MSKYKHRALEGISIIADWTQFIPEDRYLGALYIDAILQVMLCGALTDELRLH